MNKKIITGIFAVALVIYFLFSNDKVNNVLQGTDKELLNISMLFFTRGIMLGFLIAGLLVLLGRYLKDKKNKK